MYLIEKKVLQGKGILFLVIATRICSAYNFCFFANK